MDVKKLMVSFCIEDSFFSKGKKRGRHVPPLSSNNAFCKVKKRKNDIHVAWEEYYNAQSPSSSSSSVSKTFALFSIACTSFLSSFATGGWTGSSRDNEHKVDSKITGAFFFPLFRFGRDFDALSATTTFEASESAARRRFFAAPPPPTRDTDDVNDF